MKKYIFSLLICQIFTFKALAETRPYRMGFSTFMYAPTQEAIENTTKFLTENGDLYTEKYDENLPWKALLDNQPLPSDFLNKINEKVQRRLPNHKLALALTALNGNKDNIINDIDGNLPQHSFDHSSIIAAYTLYCEKMIDLLKPDYLIIGINANELLKNNPSIWKKYLKFSKEVIKSLKKKYPKILIGQSLSLNQIINPEVKSASKYRRELGNLTRDCDFIPANLMPQTLPFQSLKDYQKAFDQFHKFARKPMAIFETSQLAQDANVKALGLVFESNQLKQQQYVEILLKNAHKKRYLFVCYTMHRDCDALIPHFPEAAKAFANLIKDTGLLDENGNKRAAYNSWLKEFQKTYKP